MLELYHNDMSTCAQKVRFALAEKKLEWKDHHLNLRALDQQKPEYLLLNPNAVVPTLVDDGFVIIESNVINEYLDDKFPEIPLRPASPQARARMRLLTKKLDDYLHAATGVISTAIAFRFQKLDRGQESVEQLLANMPDAAKRERNRSTIFDGIQSSYYKSAVQKFDKLLEDFEARLADHDWLTGDTFSIADIAYAPYMARLDHLQLFPMWDRRPRVADWFERLRQRDGYQEGLQRWFNDSYLTLMQEKGQETWPETRQLLSGQ